MMNRSKAATPRRGRPSLARASAINTLLLKVAYEQFLQHGFDSVTMEQIAAVAQVAKGTLYARYSSKEALFAAMIEGALERWSSEASLRDALLTDDIEQRLRHHAQTIAIFMRNPEVVAMQRLLLSVSARFPELALIMHERGFRFIVDLIARDIMEAGLRDGNIPRDPQAIAQLLVSSLTGYQMQDFGAGDAEDCLPTFANRVVDLIMAGRAAW